MALAFKPEAGQALVACRQDHGPERALVAGLDDGGIKFHGDHLWVAVTCRRLVFLSCFTALCLAEWTLAAINLVSSSGGSGAGSGAGSADVAGWLPSVPLQARMTA